MAVFVPEWMARAFGPGVKEEWVSFARSLVALVNPPDPTGEPMARMLVRGVFAAVRPWRSVSGRAGDGWEGIFHYLEIDLETEGQAALMATAVGVQQLRVCYTSRMWSDRGPYAGECTVPGVRVAPADEVERLAPHGVFLLGCGTDVRAGRVWRCILEGLTPRLRDMALAATAEGSHSWHIRLIYQAHIKKFLI